MTKLVHADVFIKGRFYRTIHLRMETNPVWIGDKIENTIDSVELQKKVEAECPSLIGKDYRVCV